MTSIPSIRRQYPEGVRAIAIPLSAPSVNFLVYRAIRQGLRSIREIAHATQLPRWQIELATVTCPSIRAAIGEIPERAPVDEAIARANERGYV